MRFSFSKTSRHQYSSDEFNELFTDKDKQLLKSLDIEMDVTYGEASDQTGQLVNDLAQLSHLVHLNLNYQRIQESSAGLIANQLKQIGLNCRQLRSLSLNLRITSVTIMDDIMAAINQNFKLLRRLEISGYFPNGFVISINDLNECKLLTHLSISAYNHTVDEGFVVDIDKHFPSLQYLWLSDVCITDRLLNCLSKLTKIQTIGLYGAENFTETVVHKLAQKSPKLCLQLNTNAY